MNDPQEVPTLPEGALDSINGDRITEYYAQVRALMANSPLAREIAQAKNTLALSRQLSQDSEERKVNNQ